jgi:hypothetical protein
MKDAVAKTLTVLVMMALTLSCLGGSTVLCIGEDGRLNLEVKVVREVGVEHRTESHDGHEDTDTEHSCDEASKRCGYQCIDIPLPTEQYDKSDTSAGAGRVDSMFAIARAMSQFILHTSVSEAKPDPATALTASRSDTTAILRI